MKLIVQIPAFNEAPTLQATIRDIPTTIPGIDTIELLVIDDGSTDETTQVAEASGVHHIVKLPHNVGLAGAFIAGLEESLAKGADIIVNTDADNQYQGQDIPLLLDPILEGRAEIVVGDRGIATLQNFSRLKRLLQRFGSKVIQVASGLNTP